MLIEFNCDCLIGLRVYSRGDRVPLEDVEARPLIDRGLALEVQPDAAVREAVDPAPKTARKAIARKTQ